MTRLLDFILAPLLDRYEATRRTLLADDGPLVHLGLTTCCHRGTTSPRGWDRDYCRGCGRRVR